MGRASDFKNGVHCLVGHLATKLFLGLYGNPCFMKLDTYFRYD